MIVKEIIGYIGMVFVVGSFFFKDINKLRIVNTIGGIICCIYGIITKTYATMALNIACVLINMFYLLYKNKKVLTSEKDVNINKAACSKNPAKQK